MFNLFKKKEGKTAPVPAQSKEALRNLLFGNLPPEKWLGNKEGVPWSLFVEAYDQSFTKNDKEAAAKTYQKIIETPGLETRHYLQAWHFLRKLGVNPPPEIAQNVYGMVVDVVLKSGAEVVACYADHRARYIHGTGGGVFWDAPNSSLDQLMDAFLKTGEIPAQRLKAFDENPPAPTQLDAVHISILTPGGIHYGIGNFDGWSKDPMGGPIIFAAGSLIKGLVDKKISNK